MDAQGGPVSELGFGEAQLMSHEGEDPEGHGVQGEDGGGGHGDFMGLGPQGGGGRRDGASSADGGAHAHQIGGVPGDLQPLPQKGSQADAQGDADEGVEEAAAARTDDLHELHAEAHAHDGGPQQRGSDAGGVGQEGVPPEDGEENARQHGQAGRPVAGGSPHPGNQEEGQGKDEKDEGLQLLHGGD